MSFFSRKHTDHQVNDILTDPALPFMIGRLVGSAEMSAQLMMAKSEADTILNKQGIMLQAVCDWFFDPEHMPTTTVRTTYGREISPPPPADQKDTQVMYQEGV